MRYMFGRFVTKYRVVQRTGTKCWIQKRVWLFFWKDCGGFVEYPLERRIEWKKIKYYEGYIEACAQARRYSIIANEKPPKEDKPGPLVVWREY